jgi:hypothetical protein
MKYTITDSHSLCATQEFSADILAAKKLLVTRGEKSVTVQINPDNGTKRQRFAMKGTGTELYKLLQGASKANQLEVEIEVAE